MMHNWTDFWVGIVSGMMIGAGIVLIIWGYVKSKLEGTNDKRS